MSEVFNIYCDESCHLENDHQKAMVLGAVWCPLDKRREIAVRFREIKHKYGMPPLFEVKWTKISPAKREFYLDLIDYFEMKITLWCLPIVGISCCRGLRS